MIDRSMPMPSTVLQILSSQTRQDTFDCVECDGAGERQVFDAETGVDYELCHACLGSGYNTLGLLVHGLLKPPEGGYGPQELKAELERRNSPSPEPSSDGVAEPIPPPVNPPESSRSATPQPNGKDRTQLRLIS